MLGNIFASKDTEVMYLVKNTFIHDIFEDEVQEEWETKSCPGRLEESVCTEELEHDLKCVDVPQCCTTTGKSSHDSAVPVCACVCLWVPVCACVFCCALHCFALHCFAMPCFLLCIAFREVFCLALLCFALLCYALLCCALLCVLKSIRLSGASRSVSREVEKLYGERS